MTVVHAATPRRGRRRLHAVLGSGLWLVLRRLRSEPGPALTTFVLVAGTCFLFAALPRVFNSYADRGLRHAVEAAPLTTRSVRVVEHQRIAAGDRTDQLANAADRADRLRQGLPASLRALTAGRNVVVRSPLYSMEEAAPGLDRYLTLRAQSGVEGHIRVVAGRLPGVSDARVRVVDRRIPELPQTREARVVQVALSTAAARQLRLEVGDRAVLLPDPLDIAVRQAPVHEQRPVAVEVTGLFVVRDPQDAFWFGDTSVETPVVQLSQDLDTKSVFGQALVSPEEYANVLAATKPLPLAYEYRYPVEADRLDAGGLGRLTDDLARIDARYAGAGPLEKHVETGLGAVLDTYRGARSQAETMLAVAAIGLLGCALATLGLLGAFTYERRRTDTGVSRTRGASRLHVYAAQLVEGVLVAAPAGLAGWALAVVIADARGSDLSWWLALATVTAAVVLLVAAVAGVARRSLRPPGREDVVVARPSPRRLAAEGLVVIAAGVGVYLLRRRGLQTSHGFDPYLAAVPVLLGLACGIVALRIYPLPLRGGARLARRARGIALHLGLSRAARQPEDTALPIVVLVLALAIGVFSATMLRTLEAGQDRAGWRVVGADLRVDAPADASLPADLVSRLRSTGRVARAYVQETDTAAGGPAPLLVALDPPAYERVVAGTPTPVGSLRALERPRPIPTIVPALVSSDWPTGSFFQLALPTRAPSFVAVGERTSFPGIPAGTPFAIVPLAALQRVGGGIEPNRLYLSHAKTAAVRRAVRETSPGASIRSREAIAHALRAAPLVEGVLLGLRAAIVLAALYAATAVGLTALIAARSRSRDLALVRTMGGSQREGAMLAAVELAPFLVVALALGIGLGLAIPFLVEPGLDLAFFTSNDADPIVTAWLVPAGLAAGLLVLAAAAVLLAGARMRRARLDRVLRIGER